MEGELRRGFLPLGDALGDFGFGQLHKIPEEMVKENHEERERGAGRKTRRNTVRWGRKRLVVHTRDVWIRRSTGQALELENIFLSPFFFLFAEKRVRSSSIFQCELGNVTV